MSQFGTHSVPGLTLTMKVTAPGGEEGGGRGGREALPSVTLRTSWRATRDHGTFTSVRHDGTRLLARRGPGFDDERGPLKVHGLQLFERFRSGVQGLFGCDPMTQEEAVGFEHVQPARVKHHGPVCDGRRQVGLCAAAELEKRARGSGGWGQGLDVRTSDGRHARAHRHERLRDDRSHWHILVPRGNQIPFAKNGEKGEGRAVERGMNLESLRLVL